MTTTEYEIAKAVMAGKIKRLYMAGHNHKLGQVVALEYTDAPPVRFYQCRQDRVRVIVERFNRRFGTLRAV
jgi:hypothetical protein